MYLGYAYLAPPGRHLVVSDGRLGLVDGPRVHFVKPAVDILFESVAEAYGRHAIAVVLTGTGADGATGARAVHEHRGIAIAQDPDTAEFRGMPDSAISTGAVDHVVPLSRIAPLVRRLTLGAALRRPIHPGPHR